LAVPVEVPVSAAAGQSANLAAKVDYLVCAEVCVPGTANLTLSLPVVAGAPGADPVHGPLITAALAAAPKPAGLTAAFQHAAGKLTLAVAGAPLTGKADVDAYFYPYDDTLIDQAKPQVVERGPQGLTLTLAAGQAFGPGGTAPAKAIGVLVADGAAYEVTATPGPAPTGAAGLGAPGRAGGLGLPLAVVFAFLGGLILNLMPCVFPILAMKAAALAKSGGDRPEALAFLAGVVVSFALLGGTLVVARAAGQAVGWGFQLQSPLVVAVLSLIMLAAALNLSGLFEVGTSVQGLGSGLATRGRLAGAALTGALAVVVAAPCTAPFMGPALGFALTQSPVMALAVFLALALGFAAPYVALACIPALARRLPRPGVWMDGLRKALAFPMYGAAAWLLWVFAQQTGPLGLARLLAAAVLLALCAWLLGVAQRRRAVSGPAVLPAAASAVSLFLAAGAVAVGPFDGPAAASTASAQPGEMVSQPWSPDKLAALRAAGTPVLVNFTAAWCVTCQANEQVAFRSGDVAAAMKRAGAVYLVADWTKRDPAIAKALSDQGRIGVPLYLYYAKGAAEPQVLPQLLTPAIVTSALEGHG
jgi:thiol:disulfide interchange protein DsbD